MSGITDAFDNIHTRVAALLSSHSRLSDPYDLERNAEFQVKQGYGVALKDGVYKPREMLVVGGKRSQEKTFEISITRKLYARELDGAAKDTTVLQLHEDLALIINDFVLDGTLNDSAILTEWVGESGTFNVYPDKDNFIGIQATFTVEIRDVLT